MILPISLTGGLTKNYLGNYSQVNKVWKPISAFTVPITFQYLQIYSNE